MTTQTRVTLLACTISALLASCNNNKNPISNEMPIQTTNTETPPNVVKVLDRVVCPEKLFSCSQEEINKIWGICLRNGFSEESPRKPVASSREIREFVQETESIPRRRMVSIQTTDENGIAQDTEREEEYIDSTTIKGMCLGSEYILK